MVSYEAMSRVRRSWPWWRGILTGLSSLALALSIYLSWHYLIGGSMIGCGGGSSCEQVLSSRWSEIGGVLPVSGLAAGAYLAMLLASLFIGPSVETSVRRLAWGAMLVLVGAAAGSAVWFIILQKWVIGAFCPYCMTAHITGLLLAALVIWRAVTLRENNSIDAAKIKPAPVPEAEAAPKAASGEGVKSQRQVMRPLHVFGLAFIGLIMAGIMAVSQAVITVPAVYEGGQSQEILPAIDTHTAPLVGSPDANYVVTVLFDYKCPHCQQLHFMLDEAVRSYGGKLAFVLCPTPLNSQCNPYVAQDRDEFKGSCELAKVGLAVWAANRKAFAAFESWMFSFESGDRWQPRSLEAARAKAVELVGQKQFEAARANPWIDRYMQTSIRMYGATVQGGNNAVPKLVFGSRWVIPEPYDADGLISILQNSLAVPQP